MDLTTFVIALFVLPGFFSFLIVQTFTIGFGKRASAFEKTYYSLLFDIPIFIITILLLNNIFVIEFINKISEPYEGFGKLEEFINLFSNDINRIVILSIIILIGTIIIGFTWTIVIKLTREPGGQRIMANKSTEVF